MSNNPTPNASYSVTLRVKIQNSPGKLGEITAEIIGENELHPDHIIPSVFDRPVGEAVEARVEEAAYETGVARRERTGVARRERTGSKSEF